MIANWHIDIDFSTLRQPFLCLTISIQITFTLLVLLTLLCTLRRILFLTLLLYIQPFQHVLQLQFFSPEILP